MIFHPESPRLTENIASIIAHLGLLGAGFLTLVLICKAIVALAGVIVGIANLF